MKWDKRRISDGVLILMFALVLTAFGSLAIVLDAAGVVKLPSIQFEEPTEPKGKNVDDHSNRF